MSECGFIRRDGTPCTNNGKYEGRCGIHKNSEEKSTPVRTPRSGNRKNTEKKSTPVRTPQRDVEPSDDTPWEIINLPDENCYVKQMLSIPDEVKVDSKLFEEIWDLHPEKFPVGKMMGKEVEFPRWQQVYGVSYYFTGHDIEAKSLYENQYISDLLEWVKRDSGLDYNSVLINWYQDGNHYMGYHSDNEKNLTVLENGSTAPIYSFSYGQKRDFYIRSNNKSTCKDYQLNLAMPDNSCIVMCGDMQKYYKHSVPKRTGKKNPYKRRINITFRLVNAE